jgi:signal transduction histidine kinase/CheY-like chemotaxis protein
MTTNTPTVVIKALLCLLLLFPTAVVAQFIFKNDHLPQKISLHSYATIASVDTADYSFKTFLEVEKKIDFHFLTAENTDLGFTDGNYWVKFELQNTTKEQLHYFLETARPITDLVELYSIDSSGKIHSAKSGDRMAFDQRDFNHRNTIFNIVLEPKTVQKIYLHLKSDGEVINLPLTLQTSENLIQSSTKEYFVFGIFYGILTVASIINMFFFFGMREKAFLNYSLYVLFIGLMQFSLDGYFYQFIDPSGGWLSQHAVLLFAAFSTFFLGKYGQTSLRVAEFSQILNTGFKILYTLTTVFFILLVSVPQFLKFGYPIANILGLFVLLLIVISLVVKFIKKQEVDLFFITGILCMISGFVIFILNNFGQLPNTFFTANATKLGTGFEVIFLSLSMANFINLLRKEKENLNKIALKRSEEMSELKSYFLSNISHELRTPLNAIMNLTDVIVEESNSKKIKKNCQIIKYSSYSLLSSVNDILDYSKISKGELFIENAHFQPANVLEHIKNNASLRAKEHGLKFKYSIDENIPAILNGDVNKFAQVLNNVLSNAIKFTPQGFVKFDVSCKILSEETITLIFKVQDSGIGISKEKQCTIYDSFTQGSINNMRKYGGLGLGLFITKAFIDKQNGSIVFDTEEGKGTTCTITLNYGIVNIEKIVSVADSVPVYDLNGKNILVVEDNAINQMVIKKITQKWLNTNVIFANNGQEGLDCFKTNRFDLVLMDLQMPVMDGYEATIAIRKGLAGAENSNIPIIAVTADVMETTKQRVIEIGMNHYLSKPIKNETLFEAIRVLVS